MTSHITCEQINCSLVSQSISGLSCLYYLDFLATKPGTELREAVRKIGCLISPNGISVAIRVVEVEVLKLVLVLLVLVEVLVDCEVLELVELVDVV